LLALASLTQPLVNFATHAIGSLGLAGVALLTASSAIIGLPGTEPTMLFAGFDVYNHTLSLAGVIALGLVGDIVGGAIAYAIGYYASRELLERHAAKLHMSTKKLDRAHRWFERYGTASIFISRLIPVVRAAFPYAAGAAEMPFFKFIVPAALGSIPWITGLALLGRGVGSNWTSWRHHLEYVDYVGAALVVAAIGYLIVRRSRTGRGDPAVDAVGK
jgi:membrane protein DedA with SNARE-associated domain